MTACLGDIAMFLGCVTTGYSARIASISLTGFLGSNVGLRDISCALIPCTTRLVVVSKSEIERVRACAKHWNWSIVDGLRSEI